MYRETLYFALREQSQDEISTADQARARLTCDVIQERPGLGRTRHPLLLCLPGVFIVYTSPLYISTAVKSSCLQLFATFFFFSSR